MRNDGSWSLRVTADTTAVASSHYYNSKWREGEPRDVQDVSVAVTFTASFDENSRNHRHKTEHEHFKAYSDVARPSRVLIYRVLNAFHLPANPIHPPTLLGCTPRAQG